MTQRIAGTMLKQNLIRDGIDLSIEADLLYVDVTNNRIGVNTNAPAVDFEVNGSLIAGDMQISGGILTCSTPTGMQIQAGTNDISVTNSKIVLCEDPTDPQDVVNLRTLQDEIGGVATDIIVDGPTYAQAIDDPYGGSVVIAPDGSIVATFTDNGITFDRNLDVNGTLETNLFEASVSAEIGDIFISGSAIDTVTGSGTDLALSADGGYIIMNSDIQLPLLNASSVLYTDGGGNLTSSTDFTYDGTTLSIADNVDVTANLDAGGISTLGNIQIQNSLITSDTAADIEVTTLSNSDVNITTGSGVVRVDATSALKIPVGMGTERPAVPEAGYIRFNTQTAEAEIFDGVSWTGFTAEFVDFLYEAFTGDGSTLTFTLATGDAVSEKALFVDINGVVQTPLISYTFNPTLNEITFSQAPAIGDEISVRQVSNVTDVRGITDVSGLAVVEAVSGQVAIKYNSNDQLRFDGTDAIISTTLRPSADLGENLGTASYRYNNLHTNLINGGPADIAERFQSDKQYEPGTVVVLGDDGKVTECTSMADPLAVGIVSTDPAYVLNAYEEDSVAVGLVGTVPCKVVNPVNKGDLLVTCKLAGHAKAVKPGEYVPGTVIGKAMETFHGNGASVIKVLIWTA